MIEEPGAAMLAQRDIVTPGSVVPEPWANGRGVTRVLARRLGWRLSIAEIRGTAAFSIFPGVDRLLIVLGDQPLTLAIDGDVRRLAPGDAVTFAGEARVVPTPTSAGARVANLMTPRAMAAPRVHRIAVRGRRRIEPAPSTAVVVLSGAVEHEGTALPPGTALLPSEHERELTGAGMLAALTVIPAPVVPVPVP
ncbi:HutD family protein [Microbacterium sp. NPDC096154]|uniref:HutD/Ves family protein n=1 Tax=Microbacterium sp. NPDC096154 TaxID=3155549 RepID=UPI003332C46E